MGSSSMSRQRWSMSRRSRRSSRAIRARTRPGSSACRRSLARSCKAMCSANTIRRCAGPTRSRLTNRTSTTCSDARMQVEPSFEEFERRHAIGHPVLVWTTLVADLETPVSAMLKLADGRANSFLLESVEGGEKIGRYSVIGIKPDLIWRCFGDRAEVNRRARVDLDAFEPAGSGALASLRALIAECRVDMPAPLPPMAAGLFGYMGY